MTKGQFHDIMLMLAHIKREIQRVENLLNEIKKGDKNVRDM